MTPLYESDVEKFVIELLVEQGYSSVSPEEQEELRQGRLSETVLPGIFAEAVARLNPGLSEDVRRQAIRRVTEGGGLGLTESNEEFHRLLTEGVEVEVLEDGNMRGRKVALVDFEDWRNNTFTVCNQFTVACGEELKRPDVVLFVNGLPLVVIELKNPADEVATVERAHMQLANYLSAIPTLFRSNAVLVASDGLDARAGSLTAPLSRFMAWKTVDGVREDKSTVPQIETLIRGMLRPDVLLDLVRHFTVFEKARKEDPQTGMVSIETEKKIAAYHQYHAVNRAVETTREAAAPAGSRKAGVVWHTQGSGKSLSMVFYAGKLVQALDNPTIVVVTDRNDLDDQLFDTFAACKQLLRQEPVQAQSRSHIRELLRTAGGGIVFTTIQKFAAEAGEAVYEQLSDRRNVIVIADEAHRSQYGFGAHATLKGDEATLRYGFAKYLRDALPNASFIGFTGTPIEKEDISTPAVFGNYVDVYDIEQSVQDRATVPISYESRLAKVHLKAEEAAKLDAEVEAVMEGEEQSAQDEAKAKWTQLEAIVGHPERLRTVAEDIVRHFELRQEAFEGKGMIVTMSRRIAVDLYDAIVKLRPGWHSDDKRKGTLKVVMTNTSSDPAAWQPHHTGKLERKALAERMKNANDPLKLVIVCDMWLTGFDVPCLHTMYVDKPLRGHTLMQAIARVNRVWRDKPGGLIVDYLGIASELKRALATYTESGGKGQPVANQDEAVSLCLTKHEVIEGILAGFDYRQFFAADTRGKMGVILEAQEFLFTAGEEGPESRAERFKRETAAFSKAFALAVPDERALAVKDDLAFFQAVKARLAKFETGGGGKGKEEIETAIRQIVDRAVVSDGIVDIFDAAGIRKPDISILSDEFLEEVQGMERRNLALELLKKLLSDEIRTRARKNLVQSRKFSEMLEAAIRKYQNNLITAAQVIEELIGLAKDIRSSDEQSRILGLTDDEIAFYDALRENGSAKQVMRDETLRDLARILVSRVKENATIDWTIKESAQAKLRVIVKRLLNEYGYPPDEQKLATDLILSQAEQFADEWSRS